MLQYLLRENGLTPVARKDGSVGANEVNLIVMAPADMPPALAQNRIAGYIVAEPFNAVAETLGVGKVLRFTGDVWRNHARNCGYATTAPKPPSCCPRKASTATRRTACRR
ncbi:hypothetical protein G6F32_015735 [Rhizopus arrhizus]|nr:hypothetical protein G6F32_015735 [Rhizopus arrhizus]